MVVLPAELLAPFERFTLHNSPYPAHDRGCAIDLYPGDAVTAHSHDTVGDHPRDAVEDHPSSDVRAPSPVTGEVLDVRTVEAPPRAYAADHDYLILVDVERPRPAAGLVARLMHVEPAVESGDRVAIGDDLGTLVRSGYYAPWVPDHVHLGFREPGADPYRARGSVRLELGVSVEPLAWDATGEVVDAGDTYAVLDAPRHPAPGERWVGLAAHTAGGTGVLDGGLPHYDGGGLLRGGEGAVSLAGRRVGVADGRDVAWDDVVVRANGEPVTGLSLFCAREAFGAKLVGESVDLAVGERVAVSISADV